MRNKIFIIFAIMAYGQFSFGQENHFSTEDLKKMKNDTIKVHFLNELARKHKKNDSLARSYALNAKRISESISFTTGLSTSLTRLGVLNKNKGEYKEAEDNYLKSLVIEEKLNNLFGIVRAKIQLSKIYQKVRDYDKALKYSSEALVTCQKLDRQKVLASIYGTIASIYFDVNSYALALEAHLESIKIREQLQDKRSLARSYLNVGVLYNILRKKEKGLFYLNKSRVIYEELKNKPSLAKVYIALGVNCMISGKLDQALEYYQKSLNIKNELALKKKEIILNNIGVIYEKKQSYSIAEKYYYESIKLATKDKNELQLLDTYFNLGKLYRKRNSNKKALEYYEKSNQLALKYNKDLDRLSIYMGIAEAYEHIGDFKRASLFNEKHIVLRDSMDSKYRAVEIVQSKYEKEKGKNELLKKEQQINKEKELRVVAENNKKNTQLYALSGGTILLTLLFFTLFYAYKSKKARELAEVNKEIEVQKNIELLKKQELKSIKAMINGQENERKRIAKDLHDRLGSMLSVVKLNYKSIEENIDKLKEENKKQYSQANALLDEACNAVREIAHNMVSGVLTKFGLIAALEDLKNTIKGTNTFQLELITHGLDDRLENSLEIELYGIVQELIHNVIKHAKANEVSVQILKSADGVNLTVIDDGIGFNNSKEISKSGMGLKSIASRVNGLKGVFDIDTGKGNGTTINIDIPL